MPRLFTGLEIPTDVAFDLELMKGGVAGARWLEREAYHVTLRFIGDIDEGLARDLAEVLDAVGGPQFAIRLKGLGAFGGTRPHNIFVGVSESPELRRLQAAHERVCQTVGLPPEPRKFTPHVTIARLRQSRPDDVQRYIASHNLYESRPFEIARFVLYSSRPSRGGGPYAIEETYPLRLSYAESVLGTGR